MTTDLHEGVVAFRALASGRQQIVLGNVAVGEISPSMDPRSEFPICFKIALPDASSRPWNPARNIEDAKRQALDKINDWMIAAGLRPNGREN